jgi:hypothetical protein
MCLGVRTLPELLETWDRHAAAERDKSDTAPDALAREDDPAADRVVIGTIHAAKGREYASVVVADYDSDLDGLSATEVEEERRVLYVAVTRAQDAVLLTSRCRHGARTPEGPAAARSSAPHPFLQELFVPPQPVQARRLRRELRRLRRRRPATGGTGTDQDAATWSTHCAALDSRLAEYRLFGLTWRRRLANLTLRLRRLSRPQAPTISGP